MLWPPPITDHMWVHIQALTTILYTLSQVRVEGSFLATNPQHTYVKLGYRGPISLTPLAPPILKIRIEPSALTTSYSRILGHIPLLSAMVLGFSVKELAYTATLRAKQDKPPSQAPRE